MVFYSKIEELFTVLGVEMLLRTPFEVFGFKSCPIQRPSWYEVDTKPTTKPAFQIYMSGLVLAGY
jgi:hypothetical protein